MDFFLGGPGTRAEFGMTEWKVLQSPMNERSTIALQVSFKLLIASEMGSAISSFPGRTIFSEGRSNS